MNDWKTCFPRVYIIYISAFSPFRAVCPALAIKNFQRFPLCYYYIESIRFCQVFTESFNFPNMTDCTNTKCSIHSEHSRQPRCRFFRRRPYISAPESWPCASEKLTAIAYIVLRESWQQHCCRREARQHTIIYIMYISHESVQPRNRRTRNQTRIRQATR